MIGEDGAALRDFYAELFDWQTHGPAPGYGTIADAGDPEAGISGGITGGYGEESDVVLYVGVADVERALAEAERLGGTRVLGPERTVDERDVGQLRDPAGNLIGVIALTRPEGRCSSANDASAPR